MPPPRRAAAAFGLSYRPMTDRDLPFVAALYATTRAEEVAASGWPPETQKAFLAQQHQAQHHHYRTFHPDAEWLIVELEGVPVGRLYLDESDSGFLLIDISLLPQSRGAGLGGAIMTDLLDLARSRGKPLALHVERSNRARRLYVRLGFRLVEEKGLYLGMEWRPETARSEP